MGFSEGGRGDTVGTRLTVAVVSRIVDPSVASEIPCGIAAACC